MRVSTIIVAALAVLVPTWPAASAGAGAVQREVRRFDIGFLTETIPGFPLRTYERARGVS